MAVLLALLIGLLILSIILSTAVSLPVYSFRERNSKDPGKLYSDGDGISTLEVQAAFRRTTRNHIALLLLVNTVGLGVNISCAITMKEDFEDVSRDWQPHFVAFKIIAALCLFAQSVTMALTDSSTSRQVQGAIAAVCSILVYTANMCFDSKCVLSSRKYLAFLVIHSFLLIVSVALNLLIARRPKIFDYENPEKEIDNERTVSILSRYTLSWANPVLSYAMHKGRLDFQDLPLLRAACRANALVEQVVRSPGNRLWKQIVYSHRFTFASQWLLTICYAITTFAPQYFLWHLVRIMEDNSASTPFMTALWLALLGLAPLVQSWIETWMLWIGWCHIALPVSVELSALIVEKSLHKKDIKHTSDADDAVSTISAIQNDLQEIERSEDGGISAGKGKWTPKRMQDRINLISVDAQRISDFLSYNSMLMGIVLCVVISLTFLFSFIRIQSILLGLACVSFLVPLNILANRRYNKIQDHLMEARDVKANTITESVQGIRQIKFDALEPQWSKKIHAVRNAELSQQWKAYLAETALMMCWIAGPIMLTAITLSIISVNERILLPSTAFTALSVFQRLEDALSLVPQLITDLSNARISFTRIQAFLESPERSDATVDADVIAFRHATVAWPSDETENRQPTLRDLNFSFPKNEMSIVFGPTGAGKSLLLQAAIGEADIVSGTIDRPKSDVDNCSGDLHLPGKDWLVPKSTAFVAQTPWIENASIRDNIIFGLPFSETRYISVLQACDLLQDIGIMEDGDLTEVGAHGISLSGGQRVRLSLARALYSRAEILVIDDVFSAVDSHVGRHLLDHALTGPLAENRTRIVATHHVRLNLPKAGFAISLDHGTIEYAGPVDALPLSLKLENEDLGGQNEERAPIPRPCGHIKSSHSVKSASSTSSIDILEEDVPSASFNRGRTHSRTALRTRMRQSSTKPKLLVQEEYKEIGRTKFRVGKRFMKAASSWPWTYWLTVVVLLTGFEVALLGRNWWIKNWSESFVKLKAGHIDLSSGQFSLTYKVQHMQKIAPPHVHANTLPRSNRFYLVGCICISLLTSFLGTLKFFWVYVGSIRASGKLSQDMTTAVLHAPLRWLDTVPTGRVLNRFIADFNSLDTNLANHGVLFAYYSLQLVGIIVAGSLVSPYLLLLAFPLLALCVLYARQYLAGARDVKRLERIKMSPVLEQLDAILSGLGTIRTWGQSTRFVERMFANLDDHARCVWHLWLFNRWLGMRFAFIGSVFTLCVACFAVYSPNVSAALAGLALTFALEFTNSVFWVLRRYADVEMDMNSLERINEFCDIPQEAAGGIVPSSQWPKGGAISVSNLVVGYAPDLAPVLRGLSFTCEAHSRVGVIGRTGAGKSSLTLALQRFLEPRSGSIFIDGIDISVLDLHELRRRISIIPQHPVLWLGSIRSNLDPFGEYTDMELQKALERVHLNHQSFPADILEDDDSGSSPSSECPRQNFALQTQISDGGLNISHGQRQLVCLARALLSQPKVLIMDEATSAVDLNTDSVVQQSIRAALDRCTWLVIAHKLSTVIDMDKIIVLQEGEVAEMGAPKELWKSGGLFADMVRQSGESTLLEKLL